MDLEVIQRKVKLTSPTKLLDYDFPDPCVIFSNQKIYLYSTQKATNIESINVPVVSGSSLYDLNPNIHEAMPKKPMWSVGQDIWAPDVIEVDGKFIMFFSCAYNANKDMAIGVATSSSPMGPFVPANKPLVKGKWIENIDPSVFRDPLTLKNYLVWGSGFKPIKMQELDETLTAFKSDSKPYNILSPDNTRQWESLVEAPTLIYRAPYYYLFYSGEGCWIDEKYCIMVARTLSLDLPFIKMQDALQISNSIIIKFDKNILAPGHQSIALIDGDDFILFHGAEAGNDKYLINFDESLILKRKLFMKKLIYKNGWPVAV